MKKIFFILSIALLGFKLNAQNFQWAKKLDPPNKYSLISSSIKRDAQNNIIMVGMYRDTIDFDLGAGVFKLTPTGGANVDIFIAKYTTNGDFVWAKKIAGNYGTSIWDFTLDKSSNIILSLFMDGIVDVNPSTAVYNVGTLGTRTSILAKYSSSGSFAWAKTFSENAIFTKVSADNQGKIIASGHFYNTVDFNPGSAVNQLIAIGNSSPIFILKLNSTGTFSWVTQIGDASNFSENVFDLHLDNANNIHIAGRFNGLLDMDPSANQFFLDSQGNYIGYFAKYNANGNFVMARSFYSTGNSMVSNIRTDKQGNFILTGSFIGTIDLDASSANLKFTASAANDIFVTKYSSSGNLKWGFDIGNVSEDVLTNHEVSSNGNTYIFGRFKGTVDFNPSSAITNLVSAPVSQPDLFFVSYDTAGVLINAQKIGNNKAENAIAFTLNNAGELCLFGNFVGTVDFDFATANTSNLAATDQDYFIAKYNFGSNFKNKEESSLPAFSAEKDTEEQSFIVYPNPAINQLQIQMIQDIKIENIQIYNSQGTLELNIEMKKSDSSYMLDISQLSPGFHILKINNQYNKTFIKQ